MLGDFEGGFGRKSLFAAVSRSDRFYTFLVNSILEQITLRSRLECSKNLYIAFIGRQHDDLCVPKFSPNRRDGIEAVHLGHLEVHRRSIEQEPTQICKLELGSALGFHSKTSAEIAP